jgi:hypothetical protein
MSSSPKSAIPGFRVIKVDRLPEHLQIRKRVQDVQIPERVTRARPETLDEMMKTPIEIQYPEKLLV